LCSPLSPCCWGHHVCLSPGEQLEAGDRGAVCPEVLTQLRQALVLPLLLEAQSGFPPPPPRAASPSLPGASGTCRGLQQPSHPRGGSGRLRQFLRVTHQPREGAPDGYQAGSISGPSVASAPQGYQAGSISGPQRRLSTPQASRWLQHWDAEPGSVLAIASALAKPELSEIEGAACGMGDLPQCGVQGDTWQLRLSLHLGLTPDWSLGEIGEGSGGSGGFQTPGAAVPDVALLCCPIAERTGKVLGEFCRCYREQFGVALFNSVRYEIEGAGGPQAQLLHRKVPLEDHVIYSGNIFQYIEENKKWRNRFCVVPHNYGLVLYENKLGYERELPPRVLVNSAGYKVLTSVEQYLELVNNSLPGVTPKSGHSPIVKCPTDFPLLLWHPYARHYYFCVMTGKEQERWRAVFQDCVRHCNNGG
ncbi:PREDICTED: uncharacterized protein LOC101811503, partial [Ficedula albicollis]|uniref:uncharacterized protein LOC101811503 n=1 Tax=Ficedula albicollis TaxID=59894 RepID=UPI000359EB3B